MRDYFSDEELMCKCTFCYADSAGFFDPDFKAILNSIREEFGPMIPSSAYRCENHPIERVKIAPGPHNTGKAIDIVCWGADALRLVDLALKKGIVIEGVRGGIGLNQKGDIDKRFVHLDVCVVAPGRPRPHVWTY